VNWAHTTWRHHAVAPRPNGVTEEAAEEKHRVRARSALRLNVQTFESNVVAPPMLNILVVSEPTRYNECDIKSERSALRQPGLAATVPK
jgi:hypothetical protein